MNPTEPFSNLQQSAEDFSSFHSTSKRAGGIGRGQKYPGAEIPDHDVSQDDFIIMEEAYAEFDAQGERRSVRMIAEYCKTGELVCEYDTDDKRWHITRESVEQKIAKIKALNSRRAATGPQRTSEQFFERPATPHQATDESPPKNAAVYPPSDETKKLEQEIFDLKLVNRGKDYYIAQLQEERKDFITRLEADNRLIGQLETKLLQLEAPRPTAGNDTLPPAARSTTPPDANVSPHEPLADNPNDTYEYSQQ
jgi:hypothetical protein